jgi:hypothetical protein
MQPYFVHEEVGANVNKFRSAGNFTQVAVTLHCSTYDYTKPRFASHDL